MKTTSANMMTAAKTRNQNTTVWFYELNSLMIRPSVSIAKNTQCRINLKVNIVSVVKKKIMIWHFSESKAPYFNLKSLKYITKRTMYPTHIRVDITISKNSEIFIQVFGPVNPLLASINKLITSKVSSTA